jgi:hypothetical protein
MPKNLLLKGLLAKGLVARRITYNGIRTWEIQNQKTGVVSHCPTLELIYETYFSDKSKKAGTKKGKKENHE